MCVNILVPIAVQFQRTQAGKDRELLEDLGRCGREAEVMEDILGALRQRAEMLKRISHCHIDVSNGDTCYWIPYIVALQSVLEHQGDTSQRRSEEELGNEG